MTSHGTKSCTLPPRSVCPDGFCSLSSPGENHWRRKGSELQSERNLQAGFAALEENHSVPVPPPTML